MTIAADKSKAERLFATWKVGPPLSGSFPVRLPAGGRVDGFSGHCAKCDSVIPDVDLHGSASFIIPTVATITAIGLCRSCSCLTPFHHRVRAVNGCLQSEWIGGDGRWVKRVWTKARKPGLLPGLLRQMFGWLKQ